MGKSKQKILIADDSAINRYILADMLGDEFEILEAEDGERAVAMLNKYGIEISLVLLDIVMPNMDGFDVLTFMNKYHWIDDIPVIMISAENSASCVERSYELGATDYISRPFDALVVRRRALNTIMLYAKQKRLIGLIADQIYEKQKSNSLMINILSHIVEFRNGESGLHVLHIGKMTNLLLNRLVQITDKYHLSRTDISLIGTASALHDIGKIAIPDGILNKPGKFTPEEFKIMQTHTVEGAAMLEHLPYYQNEPLVKVARDICRWHHERYDGCGYPDGLKGEDIPISAQVVSLADVYDALTSERVYKKAFPHKRAMEMIKNNECGAFNPVLLECLDDISESIQKELEIQSPVSEDRSEMRKMADEMVNHEDLANSERMLILLERERTKYQFFSSLSQEIQFEYIDAPPMLTISEWGANRLGQEEIIMNPYQNTKLLDAIGIDNLKGLADLLHHTTSEEPVVQFDCELKINGKSRWHHIIARANWSLEKTPQYQGAIGKAVDIHQEHLYMAHLNHVIQNDIVTGLLNFKNAKVNICEQMRNKPTSNFAMTVIEVELIKNITNKPDPIVSEQMLKYTAERLRQNIRGGDVATRVDGSRFIVFLEYRSNLLQIIERISTSMNCEFKQFTLSIRMGISTTEKSGYSYDSLFEHANIALNEVDGEKNERYCFYDTLTEQIDTKPSE